MLKKPRLEDLEPVSTLLPVFDAIRGYLAANARGITRDEAILEELTKLLHAKICDELAAAEGKSLRFYALVKESVADVRKRIALLYEESVATQLNGPDTARELLLDEESCVFAVQALHHYRLLGAQRDVVGEAYEGLIFPALRGGQGQFFTPKNVAACLVQLLDIKPNFRVIDPACGTGGFLAEVAASSKERIAASTRQKRSGSSLFGVDKDELLVRLASDNLGLRGIKAHIVCTNSLLPPPRLSAPTREILKPESFDIVITNPPFGSKIPVAGEDTLGQFDLARRWIFSERSGHWTKLQDLRDAMPPQILFIELCWKLLKEGGRCGIVLPEGILGNQSAGYIRQWLLERADVQAVIDCPLETFMPSTSTKTVLLLFERRAKPRHRSVFMAIADKCGHDRRGNPILKRDGSPDDDFPSISEEWKKLRSEERISR
jgi:type I restriction enzyme M protein